MSKKKTALIYGAIALIFAFGILFYRKSVSFGENTVAVKSDGKLVQRINLDTVTEPFTFRVENGGYNVIYVEHGKIIVSEADCPDKLCIRQSESGAFPIVCLPHKLIIEKVE